MREPTMSIEPIGGRPAPRCYRRARTMPRVESREQIDTSTVLMALTLVTAVAVFLLFSRGPLL
jgi:hypothetical protein